MKRHLDPHPHRIINMSSISLLENECLQNQGARCSLCTFRKWLVWITSHIREIGQRIPTLKHPSWSLQFLYKIYLSVIANTGLQVLVITQIEITVLPRKHVTVAISNQFTFPTVTVIRYRIGHAWRPWCRKCTRQGFPLPHVHWSEMNGQGRYCLSCLVILVQIMQRITSPGFSHFCNPLACIRCVSSMCTLHAAKNTNHDVVWLYMPRWYIFIFDPVKILKCLRALWSRSSHFVWLP